MSVLNFTTATQADATAWEALADPKTILVVTGSAANVQLVFAPPPPDVGAGGQTGPAATLTILGKTLTFNTAASTPPPM